MILRNKDEAGRRCNELCVFNLHTHILQCRIIIEQNLEVMVVERNERLSSIIYVGGGS